MKFLEKRSTSGDLMDGLDALRRERDEDLPGLKQLLKKIGRIKTGTFSSYRTDHLVTAIDQYENGKLSEDALIDLVQAVPETIDRDARRALGRHVIHAISALNQKAQRRKEYDQKKVKTKTFEEEEQEYRNRILEQRKISDEYWEKDRRRREEEELTRAVEEDREEEEKERAKEREREEKHDHGKSAEIGNSSREPELRIQSKRVRLVSVGRETFGMTTRHYLAEVYMDNGQWSFGESGGVNGSSGQAIEEAINRIKSGKPKHIWTGGRREFTDEVDW